MLGNIAGVTRTALWQAWKEIRVELRKASVRDVVDYLDYDIEPDVWIDRLLHQIRTGTYEPARPLRFPLAKSPSFKRTLTFPNIPDLVLYRTIADFIHRRAQKYQQPHVYYRRADFHRAATNAEREAEQDTRFVFVGYRFTSRRSMLNWANYAQYRKRLIMQRMYPFIVVSDITNFFNSVLHAEVSNSLRNFPIPSRLIGLLFFLMERLALRADYSNSPAIGLPVDEFECSRAIANLVLFTHDRRIVDQVGKNAYVRWMDDQIIGVRSRAAGLRTLNAIEDSLSTIYLTPNAKKSVVLSLREATIHYHLGTNASLDSLEQAIKHKHIPRRSQARELSRIWRIARAHEGKGQWEHILKRFYRLAGLARARFLRRRARRDVLANPSLTERISDYIRCTGSTKNYLAFAHGVLRHKDQIHDDVSLVFAESLLRLEPTPAQSAFISRSAVDLLTDVRNGRRTPLFAAPASLLLLRYANRRALPTLRRCFRETRKGIPGQAIRATAVVYASYGSREFRSVRRTAAALLLNPLALIVRLIARITKLTNIPNRYKARLALRRDSVNGRDYVDMRVLLAVRLLTLNKRRSVQKAIQAWKRTASTRNISTFDRNLLRRLL